MQTQTRYPNRRAPTWTQVLNPVWLAGDDERNPAWPWLRWFVRNPCMNLRATVVGVAHKFRDVTTARSAWTFAPAGWNYGWTTAPRVPLPFLSWRGKRWEWCAGWMTSGTFTVFQFRRANSPNATVTP